MVDTLAPLPEDPIPQDYGPPENANAIQLDCWRRQQLFLEAYQRHGIVSAAAKEVGIPIGTVDCWENTDTQGFKKRKELAGRGALGGIEAEIHRRGVVGVDKPLHHKGRLTGDVIKEYSDNLLMFRAKRLDPQYRDAYTPEGRANVHITKIVVHVPAGLEAPVVEAEVRELPEGEDGSK